MINKNKILPLLALCLCVFTAVPALAGFKSIENDAKPAQCEEKPSPVLLTHKDQSRIDLATRFAKHLEHQGQDPGVITALYRASIQTDTDFELLLLKAIMESNLGRANVAATSSARGVFQYITPTWLTLIHRYGDDIGYPHYAAAIGMTRQGIPYIKERNQFMKAEILALRYDQDISALIKAYQIAEETQEIRKFKKGRVNATDHYIAHMMGLGLAKEFYDMRNKGSFIAVAGLARADMREAARLNRPFFYSGKRPLTAQESYKKFHARVERQRAKIHKIAKMKIPPDCTPSSLVLVKN